MPKMKETTKHVHSVKYSSKDEYTEEGDPKKLKAIFRIQQKHKKVFCVLRDDRLLTLVADLINESCDEDGDITSKYWNHKKLYEYCTQFINNSSIEFTAVSKCHPDDVFDIQIGKDEALKKVLEKRSKALKVIKKIMIDGIDTAFKNTDEQLVYNVHPDPSKNPNLKKKEIKQIENKEV